MGFVVESLIFLGGVGGGVILILYSYQLTQFFGSAPIAERYLGSGGTYTMWKLLGLAAIFLTIWYVF